MAFTKVTHAGIDTSGTVTTQNLNVIGVVTASSFSGQSATFTGNVSVGGTITYEDVTNVDSIGIVTARNGVVVSSGNVLIGTGTSTGTASQRLQVTGGAYVSGNLGVGITNPGSKLQIVGDIRFGKQDYSYQSTQKVATLNADGVSGLYPPASFGFYTYPGVINGASLKLGIRAQDDTNGETSDIITIVSTSSSSGNLGIGVTPESASKLHIKNLSAAAKVTIESANNSQAYTNYSAQSSEYSIGFVRDGSGNNSFRFCNADDLSTGEVARFDGSGNFGINDTSPSTRVTGFSVRGTDSRYFTVSKVTGQPIWRFDDNSTGSALLQNLGMTAANQGMGIQFQLGDTVANSVVGGSIYCLSEQTWTSTASTKDSYLRFDTTLDGVSTEKVRINSAGNVRIGATGAGSGAQVALNKRTSSASEDSTTANHQVLFIEPDGDAVGYYRRSIISQYKGINQYSYWAIRYDGASYDYTGSLKCRITWSTSHASGAGFAEFSLAVRSGDSDGGPAPAGNVIQYGAVQYSGGWFYGWTGNPDFDVYNASYSENKQFLVLRLSGYMSHNGASYDGGVHETVDLQSWGNAFQGLYRIGTSAPSGFTLNAITKTILS